MNPHATFDAPADASADASVAAPSNALDRNETARWQQLLEPVARLGAPDMPDEDEAFRLRFLQAGWRHRAAPAIFYTAKVALALLLPLLVWVAGTASGRTPGWAMLLLAAAAGLYAPVVVLRLRTQRRQRELFEALPDAIDLLVVCTEAGLGLEAALERVERDLRLRSPVLAGELALLDAELRLGMARAQALRHLAQRCGLEEARQFVASLVQADRFGLPIAQALRLHAQDLRLARQRQAEEAAAKLPLKLLFPLIFALFPALMVVLLGPAAIGLMRQMMPLMRGG